MPWATICKVNSHENERNTLQSEVCGQTVDWCVCVYVKGETVHAFVGSRAVNVKMNLCSCFMLSNTLTLSQAECALSWIPPSALTDDLEERKPNL